MRADAFVVALVSFGFVVALMSFRFVVALVSSGSHTVVCMCMCMPMCMLACMHACCAFVLMCFVHACAQMCCVHVWVRTCCVPVVWAVVLQKSASRGGMGEGGRKAVSDCCSRADDLSELVDMQLALLFPRL